MPNIIFLFIDNQKVKTENDIMILKIAKLKIF